MRFACIHMGSGTAIHSGCSSSIVPKLALSSAVVPAWFSMWRAKGFHMSTSSNVELTVSSTKTHRQINAFKNQWKINRSEIKLSCLMRYIQITTNYQAPFLANLASKSAKWFLFWNEQELALSGRSEQQSKIASFVSRPLKYEHSLLSQTLPETDS